MNRQIKKLAAGFAYVALLGCVTFYGYRAHAKLRAAAQMTEAAHQFIASLKPEQKAKAVYAFDDPARHEWEFFPRQRQGLPLKEMTPEQRALAHAFLQTGLSSYGYLKATSIMSLEPVLGALEAATGRPAPFPRDEELYFFAIYGTPDARTPWGWRIEGHHVSLHFTLVNGELVSNTPLGFGSNPAEVRQGTRAGLRVLGNEADKGRALLDALDAKQRELTVFDQTRTPGDIMSMSKHIADPLKPEGIAHAQLNPAQRAKLMTLIEEYLDRMPDELAQQRRAALTKAGLPTIHFGWAGSVKKGEGHYYRVQGKTFLIEFDNSQNNGNHIHSIWRDFNGDFGRDWLAEHYRNFPHRSAK